MSILSTIVIENGFEYSAIATVSSVVDARGQLRHSSDRVDQEAKLAPHPANALLGLRTGRYLLGAVAMSSIPGMPERICAAERPGSPALLSVGAPLHAARTLLYLVSR